MENRFTIRKIKTGTMEGHEVFDNFTKLFAWRTWGGNHKRRAADFCKRFNKIEAKGEDSGCICNMSTNT